MPRRFRLSVHHKNEFRKKRGHTVTTETIAVEEIQPISISLDAVSLYPASLVQYHKVSSVYYTITCVWQRWLFVFRLLLHCGHTTMKPFSTYCILKHVSRIMVVISLIFRVHLTRDSWDLDRSDTGTQNFHNTQSEQYYVKFTKKSVVKLWKYRNSMLYWIEGKRKVNMDRTHPSSHTPFT